MVVVCEERREFSPPKKEKSERDEKFNCKTSALGGGRRRWGESGILVVIESFVQSRVLRNNAFPLGGSEEKAKRWP